MKLVKDCALFLGVGLSTIYKKVNTDKYVYYDNKVFLLNVRIPINK